MYARATSGDKLNNNKFSVCSIRNISQVLDKKRGNCFVGRSRTYWFDDKFSFIMVSVSDFGNARWIRWTSFHTLSVILYVGCHFDRRQGLITVLSLAVWQHVYLKGSPPSWVQEDVLWICYFLFAFLKDDSMPCVKWRFMSSWQTFPSKIFKCRMFKAQQRDAFVTEQILFSLYVHVCVDVCSCTLQQSLANQPVVTA